ncbi:MAG: hypothetical protein ACREBW_00610 [Candidatus Micrarchaeaceae archaeon]
MAYKKVKLPDSENYNGSYIFGHSALGFHNGEAVIPEHQEEEFKSLHPKATVTDYDPEKDGKDLTSYYYYRMEGHDVAKEKENLSLDNVADAHALAPQRFAEHGGDLEGPAALQRQSVNNWDSTVKIVPNTEIPIMIPDEETYRSVPVTTASKAVEKRLDERGALAKKQSKGLREAYEGSSTSRDESLERGTTVRAPLDNLRTANPAQREALRKNTETAELVEMGSEKVAEKNSDDADEKYGGVDHEGVDSAKKHANERKFAKAEEKR